MSTCLLQSLLKAFVLLPSSLALMLLRCYQALSSCCWSSRCRFYPSCSHYAYSAIKSDGLLYGVWLTIKRLSRCHPWHVGGVDWPPVSNKSPETCSHNSF